MPKDESMWERSDPELGFRKGKVFIINSFCEFSYRAYVRTNSAFTDEKASVFLLGNLEMLNT